ncbi:MAG: multi-sensor hybrid histidine kinase [Bacteroidetes bacterium]|nr:multi-sensor hybrid histidine kinase [Bacteroidota bacterium]
MQGEWGVLIASADAATRDLLKEFLAVKGRRVLEASSDHECLRLARHERPDLILLDADLAGGNAAILRQTLQADPAARQKVSVLLFSRNRANDASPGRISGDISFFSAASPEMLCVITLDGRFAQANLAFTQLLGYSADELRQRPLNEYIHPDDLNRVLQHLGKIREGVPVVSFECRMHGKDGSYRWLSWDAIAPPVERLVYAVVHDVSGLREDQNKLRTLSQVVEQSPVSVMITDAHGAIEYINPKLTEVSGFTREELIGKNPRVMRSGKQSEEFYGNLWKTIASGQVWRGALQNKKKNGEIVWELETIAPVRDTEGKITHFVSLKEDLTERRSAEEKIRSQSALLDVATDAILIYDMARRLLYWNKGAESIYGWTSEEAVGRDILDLIYSASHQFNRALQTLLQDGQWHGELNQRTKDGRSIVMECRWAIARGEAGEPISVLAINTDITEKKKLEAQFLRAQRMESIGTLAGGIAHDLNNILGPILLSIDYLRERSNDEESRRVLNALESSANRGADLVRQVLMFARGVEGEHIVLQPAHLIKDIVKILLETFPKMLKITSDLPKDLWTVSGDPTQLHQVLMNLCVNARDAMPDGGLLHITAQNVTLDEHYVRANLEAQTGPFVIVTVTDTGSGILPNVLPRIFEPFYTTKGIGKGTGIGLSTVRAIVKSHGGFINVYSEMGRGSSFRVYLPASHRARQKVQKPETGEIPHGHGELLLVVDDEVSILEVTKASLESSGYRVVTAQDGTEALVLYSQMKDEIRVVLTDMMMPYLDGAATIRALRKINPRVKVIAATGLEVGGKVNGISVPVEAFLPKPYTGETLLRTIANVLEREKG